MADARHLVVGRLRRPHGLKGEVTVFPLTGDAARLFAAGSALRRMDLAGSLLGEAVEIERSRPYHREWLVKFRGVDTRDELESWRGQLLGAPADTLAPPESGEVYLHELEGFAVRDGAGTALGLVTSMYELPAGLTLQVQGPKREFLLPFKQQFVRQVDRERRVLVVELPEGMLEL